MSTPDERTRPVASHPTRDPDAGVLVAGAGPTGLTLACELSRRGVPVRIVDIAAGPAVTSRATANHARTLEVYHQMGVLDELLARGQRAARFTMHRRGRQLISFGADYSELPTRYPFTLQVDQVDVEDVLRTTLRRASVEVEWGVGLDHLDPRPDGVRAHLRHADGHTERADVAWLVGADGGHSTVRRQLGLRLVGESSERWLVADIRLDLDLRRDSLHWLHTGSGTVLLVPFATPGKWRVLDTVEIDHAEDYDLVRERLLSTISRGLGREVGGETPTWVSVFTIQQRMIERMRVGRCFVAGDAAHVHSPASGQGMNTGIQDAHNLAWKLAEVIRGSAPESLLDSYSDERVPIGRALLGSTRTATALIALRNAVAPLVLPVALGLLDRLPPMKRRAERTILRGMSGLALHYAESPLTRSDPPGRSGAGRLPPGARVGWSAAEQDRCPAWREIATELADPRWTELLVDGPHLRAGVPGEHPGVSVRTVAGTASGASGPRPLLCADGCVRRAFGVGPGEHVLIRPDGYVAARGPVPGADELDHLLGRAGAPTASGRAGTTIGSGREAGR